jgi:hypothetical protein
MSDTAAAPQAELAGRPATWLRVLLIVIAAVEGLEGLFKLPLVIERDPVIFGKGWGSYAVGAELVLTLPFALVALFFLIRGDFRRGIGFIAGIALLRWISLLPSVVNHPASFPGSGVPGLVQVLQTMVFPLLMLMVIALACKNERLTLAGILASLPAVTNWLGIAAFAVGVAIYGF